jgi:signal peptidase I
MWRYALALITCGALAVTVLRHRFAIITVTGDSMMPALAPGDRVLVRRTGTEHVRRGQIAVMEMPGPDGHWPARHLGPAARAWMIKRIAAVPGDPRPGPWLPAATQPQAALVPPGQLVVLGDNAAWSQDSRQLGYFPGDRLLGVVVRRLALSPAVPARAADRAPSRAAAVHRPDLNNSRRC